MDNNGQNECSLFRRQKGRLWEDLKNTGQRIRAGNIDFLIFTDESASEGWSDVGAEYVDRKIKNCRIWKLRSVDYIRKYMLLFLSRNAAIKSDLEWLLQVPMEEGKIIIVSKLSSFKSIQNWTINSKCELLFVIKNLLEKLTLQKEKFFQKGFQFIAELKEVI